MDRKQLQKIAKLRLEDARALLGRKRWSGAYYLCGYAVECGFKSCLLRHLGESGAVFGSQKYLKELAECWTHDLERLIYLAGLNVEFGIDRGKNPALDKFWSVTKDWKETSRYEERSEAEARTLLIRSRQPQPGWCVAMDTDTLVDSYVDDGYRLLDQLDKEGFIVLVASWVKADEEDRWSLYIVAPKVDEEGPLSAYGQVLDVLRSLECETITSSDIKLIGENHPIARGLLDIQRRHIGKTQPLSGRDFLRDMPFDDAYIYPRGRVEVTVYGMVFPGLPGPLHLSLEPHNPNTELTVETGAELKRYSAKTGFDWIVAAPEGSILERDSNGMMTLSWNWRGNRTRSGPNEVWSFAKLGLHGFSFVRSPA